jgi:hypothetical protein
MNYDSWGSLSVILFGFLFLAVYAGSLAWVYADAGRRGKTGCLWALIVFFTWPLGLIAYWLLRDQDVKL